MKLFEHLCTFMRLVIMEIKRNSVWQDFPASKLFKREKLRLVLAALLIFQTKFMQTYLIPFAFIFLFRSRINEFSH